MTDYTKLVKALRSCAENFGCPIECPRYSPADEGVRACESRLEKDAAAAIEALQAENADIREELFISQRKYDEFTTIASIQNAMLAKQLPKRGEWIEENRRPRSSQFVCSECHRTAYDPQPTRDKAWRKRCRYAYCPNCGAKMEV